MPAICTSPPFNGTSAKATFGTSVNFGVTVSSSQTPGGTVQLSDLAQPAGMQALGSAATLHAGSANISTVGLPVGFHAISAHYSGDANNLPSTSSVVNVVLTGSLDLQVTAQSNGGLSHSATATSTVN